MGLDGGASAGGHDFGCCCSANAQAQNDGRPARVALIHLPIGPHLKNASLNTSASTPAFSSSSREGLDSGPATAASHTC